MLNQRDRYYFAGAYLGRFNPSPPSPESGEGRKSRRRLSSNLRAKAYRSQHHRTGEAAIYSNAPLGIGTRFDILDGDYRGRWKADVSGSGKVPKPLRSRSAAGKVNVWKYTS